MTMSFQIFRCVFEDGTDWPDDGIGWVLPSFAEDSRHISEGKGGRSFVRYESRLYRPKDPNGADPRFDASNRTYETEWQPYDSDVAQPTTYDEFVEQLGAEMEDIVGHSYIDLSTEEGRLEYLVRMGIDREDIHSTAYNEKTGALEVQFSVLTRSLVQTFKIGDKE